MALSEIEKLERRYAENPQGLTFAPLAEVHRKNGDVARALELLGSGLTLHPDYIPASIVLGRCHLDLSDLPSAEAAFTHVLSLDGENVIALKALADISERQHRFDDAERWLRNLLAVDRSNDEARDQLGRIEEARRHTVSAAPAAAPTDGATAEAQVPAAEEPTPELLAVEEQHAAAPDTTDESPVGRRQAAAEQPTAPAWATEPAPTPSEGPPVLELEDLDSSADDGAPPPPPEGIQVEQPVSLDEPVEPLTGLVGRDREDHAADGEEGADAWKVETEEDIVLESAGGGEFQVANAAEELLTQARPVRESDPLMPERPPISRMPDSEPAPPAPEPVAELPKEVPVAATDTTESVAAGELPSHPEPDLVVTESMATLLLEQGHRREALTVYRHLEARTADPRFQEKIADLESESAAGPASAPQPESAKQAYSVRATNGQSVQSFLRGVLAGRLTSPAPNSSAHGEPARAPAETATGGAPTRPAHDSLSLSSVFGEESTPAPPAVPAAGGAGAPAGGVSYDEFFGGGSAAARPSRSADAKSDDLDQFHAWLQNLKR